MAHGAKEMFRETQHDNLFSDHAQWGKEDPFGVDSLLEQLADGQVASVIADAARLAVAKHMLEKAQEMQSAVEAENSTQLA